MPDKKKKSLPSSVVHEVQPRGLTLRAAATYAGVALWFGIGRSEVHPGAARTDEGRCEGRRRRSGFVTKISRDFPAGSVVSLPHKGPSALWLAVDEPKEFSEAITEACVNSTTLEPTNEDAEDKFQDTFAKTDTGSAERMVAWYGSEFRYSTASGR